MENKTRKQLVIIERDSLIREAVKDGFYLFEVGQMFKMSEGRVSQIVKVVNKKSNKK